MVRALLPILLHAMVSSTQARGPVTYKIDASGREDSFRTPEWLTPSMLAGECSTVWTSSFWKYILPYRVRFGLGGDFYWWAPYQGDGPTEVGVGTYLTDPMFTVRPDGSWEAHYFGANRFTPNPLNATNCCCEYVAGRAASEPRVLADYFVAVVPSSSERPMEEVCAPYKQQCPSNNATAFQLLGSPFIEVYSTCWPLGAAVARFPSQAVAGCAVLLAMAVSLCALRGCCCGWAHADADTYRMLDVEAVAPGGLGALRGQAAGRPAALGKAYALKKLAPEAAPMRAAKQHAAPQRSAGPTL